MTVNNVDDGAMIELIKCFLIGNVVIKISMTILINTHIIAHIIEYKHGNLKLLQTRDNNCYINNKDNR